MSEGRRSEPGVSATLVPAEQDEWLEADGLGGFASGTTLGLNTRRYHGLLLVAVQPPAGRQVLVNDAVVWLERDGQRLELSSHRFTGAAPEGVTRLAQAMPLRFRLAPWPHSEHELGGGVTLTHEVSALSGMPIVLCSWSVSRPLPGAVLCVRPLLSGRNFHALHHENPACNLTASVEGEQRVFHTYARWTPRCGTCSPWASCFRRRPPVSRRRRVPGWSWR